MRQGLWRHFVAGFVMVVSVSGCVPLPGSSESESTSSGSTAETVAAESSDSTSVEISVAPPTVPDTTVPETTVPVDPCAEFEALLGYQRMMAVKAGKAPSEKACKPAVDRSTLALNTYETSLAMTDQFVDTSGAGLAEVDTCDDPIRFSNVFEAPILIWGVSYIIVDDELVSYQRQSTDVIPPGGSTSLTIPGRPSQGLYECRIQFAPIVAPAGGLAAGIDGAPAPNNDPQASDDPQVWGLALLEPDTFDFGIAQLVNRSEDIHSTDVGLHLRALESGELKPRAEQPTFTVCESEPADLGPDVAGEYAWLVYARQTESEQQHAVGLFSRGADRRWRFLGATQIIDEVVDPADPCKMTPRSG